MAIEQHLKYLRSDLDYGKRKRSLVAALIMFFFLLSNKISKSLYNRRSFSIFDIVMKA